MYWPPPPALSLNAAFKCPFGAAPTDATPCSQLLHAHRSTIRPRAPCLRPPASVVARFLLSRQTQLLGTCCMHVRPTNLG